jgi:hypothetical protein
MLLFGVIQLINGFPAADSDYYEAMGWYESYIACWQYFVVGTAIFFL